MASAQEALDYARHCVRLRESPDQDRKHLLQLARAWMAIAIHKEKRPAPKQPAK
jgi:hypothetical protein